MKSFILNAILGTVYTIFMFIVLVYALLGRVTGCGFMKRYGENYMEEWLDICKDGIDYISSK